MELIEQLVLHLRSTQEKLGEAIVILAEHENLYHAYLAEGRQITSILRELQLLEQDIRQKSSRPRAEVA